MNIIHHVNIGDVCNRLTAVGEPVRNRNGKMVPCRCECGRLTEVEIGRFAKNIAVFCSRNCVKRKNEHVPEDKKLVRIDDNFNYLTAITDSYYKYALVKRDYSSEKTEKAIQYARFRCKCGNEKEINCRNVVSEKVVSCGCYKDGLSRSRRIGSAPDQHGIKKCSRCLVGRTLFEYRLNKHATDGFDSICNICRREIRLIKEYNLTLLQYEEMLKNQNDTCKCCGKPFVFDERNNNVHIDHCHSTGMVRGILCRKCNVGIGCFEDSVDNLQKAIDYLRNSS